MVDFKNRKFFANGLKSADLPAPRNNRKAAFIGFINILVRSEDIW
jgi:hypothetical protein